MPVISSAEVFTVDLPFRFAFGHALAERHSSTGVYVRLTLDDGSTGYGEGVPREYVTGETVEGAVAALADRYLPALLGRTFSSADELPALIGEVLALHSVALGEPVDGAACCALELALLDAAGKHFGLPVAYWLGGRRARTVRYDAVVPFEGRQRLVLLGAVIRLLGIRKVKVKVGNALSVDLANLRLMRCILGRHVDLRVDANCAWGEAEALSAIEAMRPYGISVVEEPLPASDLDALRRLTAATTELIAVDESLRTAAEAEALARVHACDAFNIRVSKCGGLLASLHIARIARQYGLTCIVGAQVGESGILSAAGRHLAAAIAPRYLEGSAGRLLLKEDLTTENVLPGFGGRARVFGGPGLGITVVEERLRRLARTSRTFQAGYSPAPGEHPRAG